MDGTVNRCVVLSIVIWTSARIFVVEDNGRTAAKSGAIVVAPPDLINDIAADVKFLKQSADKIRMIRAHRFETPI
jgi:hypothetical protein